MSKNRFSIILSLLFFILVGNSIFYFVVPYENDDMILEAEALEILDNLIVSSDAYFTTRSQNQSVDISLICTQGSIDIVVLDSSEWPNWYFGDEYAAYYESTNTSFVDTVIQIHPSYIGIIYIVISTNYGDAIMNLNIYSRSISYDDTTAVFSLIGAFSLGLVLVYHHKKPQKIFETQSVGPQIL